MATFSHQALFCFVPVGRVARQSIDILKPIPLFPLSLANSLILPLFLLSHLSDVQQQQIAFTPFQLAR